MKQRIFIFFIILTLIMIKVKSFTSYNNVCYISFQKPTQQISMDYHNLSVSFSSSLLPEPNPRIYCKLRNLSNSQVTISATEEGNLLSDRFIITHTGNSNKHFVAWDILPVCGENSVTTTFKIRYFNCANKADIFYSSLNQTNKAIYNPSTNTFIRTSINKPESQLFFGSDIFLTGNTDNLTSFCSVINPI